MADAAPLAKASLADGELGAALPKASANMGSMARKLTLVRASITTVLPVPGRAVKKADKTPSGKSFCRRNFELFDDFL